MRMGGEMKLIVVVAGVLAASPALAAAQASLPIMLQLPGSTRALGTGNAYPLAAPDPDVLFYNPALIDAARGLSGSLAMYGESGNLLSVTAATDWWHGSIALGVQTLTYDEFVPETNNIRPLDPGIPAQNVVLTSSSQIGTAAYARSLFGFRFGIAGKFVDQRVAGEHDVTVAGDIGVARNLGRFVVGLAGRNLGRDPEFAGFSAELPSSVSLAAASRSRAVGPLDLSVAATGSWYRDERFGAGGGIEAGYYPITGRTFTARVGFRWIEDSDLVPITVGGGFTGDRIGIDYAYEGVDNGDAVHRFTIRWR
jgi:hypothetical protein